MAENTPKDLAGLIASPSLADTKTAEVNLAADQKQVKLNGGYSSIEQFDRLNPTASYGERQLTIIGLAKQNQVANAGRSTSEIAGDAISSISQVAINNTAGIVAGLALAGSGAGAETYSTLAKKKALNAQVDAARKGINKDPFAFANPYLSPEAHDVVVQGYPSAALDFSKGVSDLRNSVAAYYDSDSRKGQQQRYEAQKKEAKESPEYKGATGLDKVLLDAKIAVEGLKENPLVTEDIIAQGVGDIFSSSLTGVLVAKQVTKAALEKGTKEILTDPVKATKIIEDALEGTTTKKITTGVSIAQGALTEGGSGAATVAENIRKLSHEELLDSKEYMAAYEGAEGTDEEKHNKAKDIVAANAASGTFVGTGLTSALISKLTGADKAAVDALTTSSVKTAAKAGAGILKEGVEETTQSITGTVIGNVAEQGATPSKDITEGVGESAVQGLVGGLGTGGAVQAPQAVVGSAKLAGKGAAVVAKGALKGTVATAKLIGKGLAKAAKARTNKGNAADTTETPTSTSTGLATITEAVDTLKSGATKVSGIQSASPAVAGVQASVKEAVKQAERINSMVNDIDPEEVGNLSVFLKTAFLSKAAVDDLITEVDAALVDEGISEEEAATLTALQSDLKNPAMNSITGSLITAFDTQPELAKAVNLAFDALTKDDTEMFNLVVGAVEQSEEGTKFSNTQLKQSLLQTALYSMDIQNDDALTVEQLRAAAKLSDSPDVKAAYEAHADIKGMADVANDVVRGNAEFKGVIPQLAALKKAISTGATNKVNSVMRELNHFADQRTEKLNALREGLDSAKALPDSGKLTVTYGAEGEWKINNTPDGIKATEDLIAQVAKEEALVHRALRAANTLTGEVVVVNEDELVAAATAEITDTPADKVVLKGSGRQGTKNLAKDQAKSDKANKFIGFGREGSSTSQYAEAWGDSANTGNYTEEDSVFVSVNGGVGPTTEAFNATSAELDKAMGAGAVIITDTPEVRNTKYNATGEGIVAAHLSANGYVEDAGTGVWRRQADKENSPAAPAAKKTVESNVISQTTAVTPEVIEAAFNEPKPVPLDIEEAFNEALDIMIRDAAEDTPDVTDKPVAKDYPTTEIFEDAIAEYNLERQVYEALVSMKASKEMLIGKLQLGAKTLTKGSVTDLFELLKDNFEDSTLNIASLMDAIIDSQLDFGQTGFDFNNLEDEEELDFNTDITQQQEEAVVDTAREEAITAATEMMDIELNELQEYKRIRERSHAIRQDTAERAKSVTAYEALEKSTKDLAAITREIDALQSRRDKAAERAARAYDLNQLDWNLGIDAASGVTPARAAVDLVEDIFSVVTGKEAITQIEGEYADYELSLSNPKSVRKFLRDKTMTFTNSVIDFVTSLSLNEKDKAAVTRLLGNASPIARASQVLANTLAALKEAYIGKFDLGLENANRFKLNVTAYRPTKLWQDTDVIAELSKLGVATDTEIKDKLVELGFDVRKINEYDYKAVRELTNKRKWFYTKMGEYNRLLVRNLNMDSKQQGEYAANSLRFLLNDKQRFPKKVVDAAFIAYLNATSNISESVYNDASQIQSLLGLSDKAQLADEVAYPELRVLGNIITANDMVTAFRQALGLSHHPDTPQSVKDSVYTAMGGTLLNLLRNDDDFVGLVAKDSSIGQLTGYTLKTNKGMTNFNKVHGTNHVGTNEDNNFTALKNKSKGTLAQISEPEGKEPSYYIDEEPPAPSASDTHIRSRERLTPDELLAETISRKVKHVIDKTIGSFHTAIGEEGYKYLKGFIENTDDYNAEHKLSVDGKNQEILSTFEDATTLLEDVAASDTGIIYYPSSFSSVRRQQKKGPQSNKYMRALVGYANNAVIPVFNFNSFKDKKAGSWTYNFILAAGQAYGLALDKQDNDRTFREMAVLLTEIKAKADLGEGVYADLMDNMNDEGEFVNELSPMVLEALLDETKDKSGVASDHKLQGVLTVAKLLKQTKNGVAKRFSHQLRIEVDGVTNGPAHAAMMGGLVGLSPDAQTTVLNRYGFITGNGSNNNTHQQIERGTITDAYLTVVGRADEKLANNIAFYKVALDGNTPMPAFVAKLNMEALGYLATKPALNMTANYSGTGKDKVLDSISLKRNATKNSVTVTVYGGGKTGIHKKMAAEAREVFAEELTGYIADIKAGKLKKKELVLKLNQWANALTGRNKTLQPLINNARSAKTQGEIVKVLKEFTFTDAFREESTERIANLFGKAITEAIDEEFSANKRTAALMNVALNTLTGLANATFTAVYEALHAKRIAEGTITKFDTLSSADIGLLQRIVEKQLPFVKTAIGDKTDISKRSLNQVSNTKGVGVKEVRFPTLGKKGNGTRDIIHSTTAMGLPGVRAIPMLTISIDGSTQIINHILQGEQGKHLNVLDANDRVADRDVRAATEVFNAAEFMSLMSADTLASVQKAVLAAFQSQSAPIDVEGVMVTPVLAQLDPNETAGRLTMAQEVLRTSLQEQTAPIATQLKIRPIDVGDLKTFMSYLVTQLEAERKNSQIARNNYVFGNQRIAINQMAGMNNGHADVINGQLQLSEEAMALVSEEGKDRIRLFNNRQLVKYRAYLNGVDTDAEALPNTELEELRQRLEDNPQDEEAMAAVFAALKPLNGLFQNLRSNGDFSTSNVTYTLSMGSNMANFKKLLAPKVTNIVKDTDIIGVEGKIPTLGDEVNKVLGAESKFKTDMLDRVLLNTEIVISTEVTKDFPAKAKGMYHTRKQGNRLIHVITLRDGISVKEANTVLAHELIHAITAGGIEYGVNNPNSTEGQYVRELERQMRRMIAIVSKFRTPERIPFFNNIQILSRAAAAAPKGDNGPLILALQEYIAIVGSSQPAYQGLLERRVSKDKIAPIVVKGLEKAWGIIVTQLYKVFGTTPKKKKGVATYVDTINASTAYTLSESDILAQVLSGLGENGRVFTGETSLKSEDILTQAQQVFKALEGQANNFVYTGTNLAIKAVLNTMGRAGIDVATRYANTSPEDARAALTRGFDSALNGDLFSNKDAAGVRRAPVRAALSEFLGRHEANSKALDRFADKAKHAADSVRESDKVVVRDGIDEATGQLDADDNVAILNLAVRGEILTLGNERAKKLLGNPALVEQAIEEIIARVQQLPISRQQQNFMVNEAIALGMRGVVGGATSGYNLPNAKAIVKMIGVNLRPVSDPDGSIEAMIDELATIAGIRQATDIDKKNMLRQLTSNPEGMMYVHNTHAVIRENILKQYGVGKALSLPKGYVPDQRNPNRAIKVVDVADVHKYKGFHVVRRFKRDTLDRSGERDMVMLASKEGGAIPHVQGAMSTIEAAVGGFSTKYGSALDKSLPALKGAEALKTAKLKERLTDPYTSAIRPPIFVKEGMIPNVNGMGKIIGYRYAINNTETNELLDTSTDVADVLSAYHARIGEQHVAENYNKELVSHLKAAWESTQQGDIGTYSNVTDDYVKVFSGSSDPQIAELWRVIPEHTKAEIKKQFGGNYVMVHKRDLDNAFGYREWSISKLWAGELEVGSKRALFVDAMEAVLGEDAVNKLRFAERILQEATVAAKDLIVVKSIVVPAANIISNVVHLSMRGVEPQYIIKESIEAVRGLRAYKEEMALLRKAKHRAEVTGEDMSSIIAPLEESLANNKVAFMVEAGLLPSVIADVEGTIERGSVKESILDRWVPDAVKNSDNAFIDAGKFLLITQGSSSYTFLADALEAGDFAAKYVLYNHLMREGEMTSSEAEDTVRSEFINYNTLSSRELDYMNKVGGVFFFKYFSRIQPIIYNTIKENPTRAFTTFVGVDSIGLPSIFEAMLVGKDITEATGAYDLLRMAGGAHPIEGLL